MFAELLPHLGIAVVALSVGLIWEVWTDPDHEAALMSPQLPSSLGYAVLNIALVTPAAIHLLAAIEPYVRPTAGLAVHPLVGLVLGFFIFEGISYGLHRLWHAFPMLMRFHRVHHGPRHLHTHVAFRMHPVEVLAYILVGNLPLMMLGMPAWGGLYVLLAERVYAVLLHTRVPFKLGVVGKVFASGEFHHRHHAPGARAYNFGGVVSLFDHQIGRASCRERV